MPLRSYKYINLTIDSLDGSGKRTLYRPGLANLFNVECQNLDLQSDRVTKYLACQDKNKEYWTILTAYNITFPCTEASFHFFHVGQQSKVPTQGVNGAMQSAIEDIGLLSSTSAGSWAEPQSQTVFGKYLIEWSSFSSTVYHVRKTAHEFKQIDDVVGLILF